MNFNFLVHAANITPNQAHFCTWEGLSNLCSALLTGYFKRPMFVEAVEEEHSDGWSLKLGDTPLSKEELTSLMDVLHADDYDRDANEFGEYPIQELSQSLGRRLVAATLPFTVEASHAADDGVWFTGHSPAKVARILIQYPEADCTPDMLVVPIEDPASKEEVITAFRRAMRFEDAEVVDSLPDRLTRLDLVIADMEIALNTRITAFSIDAADSIGN